MSEWGIVTLMLWISRRCNEMLCSIYAPVKYLEYTRCTFAGERRYMCFTCSNCRLVCVCNWSTKVHLSWATGLAMFTRADIIYIICWNSREGLVKTKRATTGHRIENEVTIAQALRCTILCGGGGLQFMCMLDFRKWNDKQCRVLCFFIHITHQCVHDVFNQVMWLITVTIHLHYTNAPFARVYGAE